MSTFRIDLMAKELMYELVEDKIYNHNWKMNFAFSLSFNLISMGDVIRSFENKSKTYSLK